MELDEYIYCKYSGYWLRLNTIFTSSRPLGVLFYLNVWWPSDCENNLICNIRGIHSHETLVYCSSFFCVTLHSPTLTVVK